MGPHISPTVIYHSPQNRDSYQECFNDPIIDFFYTATNFNLFLQDIPNVVDVPRNVVYKLVLVDEKIFPFMAPFLIA